jgi:hypothetical protein
MMLDATQKCFDPLTAERLFDWHAALFPTGRSGMYKIKVADWRKDTRTTVYHRTLYRWNSMATGLFYASMP